ncbi:spore cortex biosynthesis protein YabQ [Caldicellulosiruptor kronotskyensis]|uniref:spore cortex biosynthesis protein YabQ n=1 Tax=Caldicellulosiruptor kronotskyensis TaxID=413889 RepID=UPI002FDE6A8E
MGKVQKKDCFRDYLNERRKRLPKSIFSQISDFTSCFFLGFAVGIVFDSFFFKRILKRRTREILFFISSILSTAVLIAGLMFINFYTLKWYTFLSIACGIYVYKNTISPLYKGFLKKVNKVLSFNKR